MKNFKKHMKMVLYMMEKKLMDLDMVRANFIIQMEDIMMENGVKVKWKDMVHYIIRAVD